MILAMAGGCTSTSRAPGSANAKNARTALSALKADAALVGYAADAMQEAEAAVQRAETAQSSDSSERDHLGYLAEVAVEIARARAEQAEAETRVQEFRAAQLRQREAEAARAAEQPIRTQPERPVGAETRTERLVEPKTPMRSEMAALDFKPRARGYVLRLPERSLFISGGWEIAPHAQQRLDRLAEFLRRHGQQTVVEGYTDAEGDDPSNFALSQRRADAVAAYLTSRGVPPELVSARGRGETLPIADNDTVEGRQQNRRIEIVVSD